MYSYTPHFEKMMRYYPTQIVGPGVLSSRYYPTKVDERQQTCMEDNQIGQPVRIDTTIATIHQYIFLL